MQEVLVTFRATQKPTSFPRRFAGFDVGRWTLDVRCSDLRLGLPLGDLGVLGGSSLLSVRPLPLRAEILPLPANHANAREWRT